MKTSIIIPVWNNLEYTQQCLEAVDAFTPEEHEIIIIDNGSTDGTHDWLTSKFVMRRECKIICNETNLGAGKATNQGISIATGDYLVLLNNDVIVSREWLKGLIECADSASDIAMVGPKTNNASGPQIEASLSAGYDTLLKYQTFSENYRKSHKGLYIPFWRIVPFCGLIKADIMRKVGPYDERFFPGNYADDDICLRACLLGYRNMICCDVFVHHHGSKTMAHIDFAKNLEDSRKLFDEKWEPLTGKTISAVMIVKDEGKNIGECISNLYTQVDEIIVVDTGSKDRTKAIAAGAGPKVKVYDFPWCDDFSAARNFANSKATMDWLFSVDADEVVTGIRNVRLKPYQTYRVETRNYNNNPRWTGNTENEGEYPDQEKGMRWFSSTKIRLWPNDKRIKFEYPVHEVVEQSVFYLGMQINDAPEIVVHHYGRLNDDYEYGHGDRYWKLLQKQLKSGVNDRRSLEQLALQAQSMKKYADARKFWEEILVLEPGNSQALLNTGHCFAEEGNWTDALIWSRKALAADPESKEAAMNTATCECMAGDRELAEKMCKDLIAKYPRYPLPAGLLNALEISKQQTGGK